MNYLSLISNGSSAFHFWMGSAVTLLVIDVVLLIASAILAVTVKRMEKKLKGMGYDETNLPDSDEEG